MAQEVLKMVVIMDISTGKRLDEISTYDDEVLHANWMPREALQLGLQSAVESARKPRAEEPRNVDAFLHNMYLYQE